MSEAHFPTNLQLHEQSAREIDMVGKEHIRVPDTAEDEHWNRLSIKANTEEIDLEKAKAMALRIERYREVKRNLLQKALRRVDPDAIDAPIGENGSNVSVKRTERPRDALLVWAKEAGVDLTPEEIDSLFPEHEGAEQYDGAWVVQDIKLQNELISEQKEPSKGDEPLVTNILTNANPEDLLPQTEQEISLQKRIEEEEASFLAFGEMLLPRIAQIDKTSPQNQAMKDVMSRPFQMMEQNLNNPCRNAEVVRRISGDSYPKFVNLMQSQGGHCAFGYGNFPEHLQHMGVLAFAPLHRTIMLPENMIYGPNIFHEFIKYHELIHILNAARFRSQMDIKEYLSFYICDNSSAPEQRNVLEDELWAYGVQLEAFNLLLGGQIQKNAQQGKMMDVASVLKCLNIPQQLQLPVQLLLYFGVQFYAEPRQEGQFPPAYKKAVLNTLLHDGYTPYSIESGKFERMSTSYINQLQTL